MQQPPHGAMSSLAMGDGAMGDGAMGNGAMGDGGDGYLIEDSDEDVEDLDDESPRHGAMGALTIGNDVTIGNAVTPTAPPLGPPSDALGPPSDALGPPSDDPPAPPRYAVGQLLRLKRPLGAKYFRNEVKVGYLADVVQVTRSFPDHDSLYVVWYSNPANSRDLSRAGEMCRGNVAKWKPLDSRNFEAVEAPSWTVQPISTPLLSRSPLLLPWVPYLGSIPTLAAMSRLVSGVDGYEGWAAPHGELDSLEGCIRWALPRVWTLFHILRNAKWAGGFTHWPSEASALYQVVHSGDKGTDSKDGAAQTRSFGENVGEPLAEVFLSSFPGFSLRAGATPSHFDRMFDVTLSKLPERLAAALMELPSVRAQSHVKVEVSLLLFSSRLLTSLPLPLNPSSPPLASPLSGQDVPCFGGGPAPRSRRRQARLFGQGGHSIFTHRGITSPSTCPLADHLFRAPADGLLPFRCGTSAAAQPIWRSDHLPDHLAAQTIGPKAKANAD